MRNHLPILLTFFIFLSLPSSAQLKRSFTNSELSMALEKVIVDMPNRFAQLKGPVIAENPQSTEYATLLKLNSVESNSIVKYSGNLPVYSWMATVLSTESFEDAVKKYKGLFQQLQIMNLKLHNDFYYTLAGNYVPPSDTKKFCSSIFKLKPDLDIIADLKVDVTMQYEFPEWKVNLIVYQGEREDYESGSLIDGGK
ncbi:MAG TPA: hypothetical protein VM368_04815 [Flavisolibacter sp.]|nr:hypothetical protein [Flavisolibacter sp.]